MGTILEEYIGTAIGSIPPFPTEHQGSCCGRGFGTGYYRVLPNSGL